MTSPITNIPRGAQSGALHLPVARGAGLTHRGMIRERNEDSILTDPSGTLWAVADGMGGYGHGDVASDIVIDCLADIPDDADPAAALVSRIEAANEAVLATARSRGLGRMGSTVVALMIQRAIAYVAWAGDSRAYLLRNGKLRPITRDHTVVQDMVDRGELSTHEAEDHPESHVITRAVGGADEIEVDSVALPLFHGDRLLLCSDGLPRCVYEGAIEAHLAAAASPEAACQALIREALDNGAPDNVSVIVIDLAEG